MSLKVVLGNLEKAAVEQRSTREAAAIATSKNAQSNPLASQALQQQATTRVSQSSSAVVTTLRAFRASGTSEPLKSADQAEKLATAVAEKIRDNKDDAIAAHDGVSSDKTAPVLVS